jgi:hypothetical protein
MALIVDYFFATKQTGNGQRVCIVDIPVYASLQCGESGISVSFCLLSNDCTIIIRTRDELILVERFCVQIISLKKCINFILSVVKRQ